MPHLLVEATRASIEREILTAPIEFGPDGKPADILAPPVPILRTIPTPLSIIRMQLIVRTVSLQSQAGSSQCTLLLSFDDGSVELPSLGQSEGSLGGTITVPFSVAFLARPAKEVPEPPSPCPSRGPASSSPGQVAQLFADFTNSTVGFFPAADSDSRLTAKLGRIPANMVEAAIQAALTALFRAMGVQPVGFNLKLTPGAASEDLFTVDSLPGVVWVNPETLALYLRYAPEAFPPPFLPTPFLPAGNATALALRLSNDGFQRTVRNPAVRKLARDMLWERKIGDFVNQVQAEEGRQGAPTDDDRQKAATRLTCYLRTPQGLAELANETPSPTGNGHLSKPITGVPYPLSDFNVEVPELDLWLGQDRIEGRANVEAEVPTRLLGTFHLNATIRFRARPVLVTSPSVAIEMHDVEIDRPDISIGLPPLLEAGFGILAGILGGTLFGAIVGFLLSSIISSLAEALIPSNLGSMVPEPDAQPIPGLPPGVTLTEMTVIPEYLEMRGRWNVSINDPRPFWDNVWIAKTVKSRQIGDARDGTAWFACLAVLGIVTDSDERFGTRFDYKQRTWESDVTAEIAETAVPLPFTRFPWTIRTGYRSPAQYHLPVVSSAVQPLVPGTLTFTADTWNPEPPLGGQIVTRTFSINVTFSDEKFFLHVPPEAGCIMLFLNTKVVDAVGKTWELSAQIDVDNETVEIGSDSEGTDFRDFTSQCKSQHHEWHVGKEPSLLDKIWNPPDVYAKALERAIRTEQPAVTSAIGSLIEAHGKSAFNAILAPSLLKGRR